MDLANMAPLLKYTHGYKINSNLPTMWDMGLGFALMTSNDFGCVFILFIPQYINHLFGIGMVLHELP